MLKPDEPEVGSRIPGRIRTQILLPDTIWKEFDVIARTQSVKLSELLVQSIYWTSAPFRSDSIPVTNLQIIEMPNNSCEGSRVFDLQIPEQIYLEIEDLGRTTRVDPRRLMTQFLLHTIFDGPLAGTLRKLTGEEELKRQSTWKPEVRRTLGLVGGAG